jgi:beta-glucosidase
MGIEQKQVTRRGAVALALSAGLGLTGAHGVADSWRGTIDSALGTTSTEQTADDKFTPSIATTDDLVKAHEDLGRRVGQEGTVLMKNEGQALPLAKGAKITLLGMGSMYPFLGGKMGSEISTEDAVDLVSGLEQGGFEINPTMTGIYETLGAIEAEADPNAVTPPWGASVSYKYRPNGFATPYVPNEPSPDTYVSEGGASEDYASSFAEYGDAAIVVLSRPGSEGSDFYPGSTGIDSETYGTKNALGICTNERALIQLAEENFDKVIVLVNSCSTMELGDLKNDDKISSIVFIGFPGAYGTLGIADVLNGTVSPSGCLPDTYAVDTAMAPAAQNFGSTKLADTSMIKWPSSLMGEMDTDIAGGFLAGSNSTSSACYLIEAEGIYTGYKYYETRYYDSVTGAGNATGAAGASNGAASWNYDDEVVYPFGYGLSYATFQQTLDDVQVNTDEKTVTAKITVTNTGSVAGKHAAQLYVSVPYTDYNKKAGVEKSAIQLIGVVKTDELKPGDDQQLTITADLYDMASWDSSSKDGKGGWILDGGDYCFVLADDAHSAVNDVLAAQGNGSAGDASKVSIASIGSEGTVDESALAKSKNGTEVVNQLTTADVNYYKPGYATQLTRTDWNGTFPRTYDDLTIDGDKQEEWVKSLCCEEYQITQNGEVTDVNGAPAGLTLSSLAGDDNIDDAQWDKLIDEIPVDTLFAKIIKGGNQSDVIPEIENPVVYQNDGPNGFGTTISGRGLHTDDPNANYALRTMATETLLAATFDPQIGKSWGELLGNDGLWSGNYLIWASAANIHRCAYNGRNFEYYSEDPVLSSLFCNATVGGALAYGVIIGPKHFAFNDQETKRGGVAPYMTEQKAREGDLRAFRASIEDGGALGLMTSFCRIGADPCNGSLGLLRAILRDEWGFKGILSTDMVSNPGYYRPEMCIYGGVTMMADFSTDETLTEVQESWPYMTHDLIVSDATLVEYARQNMKYQLYAFAQSAAQNIKTVRVTPWWEMALNGATVAGYGLAAVFGALYVRDAIKGAHDATEAKEEN